MMRAIVLAALLALAGCVGAPAPVTPPAAVAPDERTLAQEIAATPALGAFAAQLRASGMTPLDARGPVTVFAADDTSHARLAPGVVAALLEPDNRGLLTQFVRYHLVAGALDTAALRARVAAGGGSAVLPTLAGEPLTVTLTGDTLTLTDADGDRAYLSTAPVVRAGSVLHIVDGVIAPSGE